MNTNHELLGTNLSNCLNIKLLTLELKTPSVEKNCKQNFKKKRLSKYFISQGYR